MKKLFRIVTLGAILLLMAGVLTACGKTKIDVMEGLELNFSGVNGYGTVSIVDSHVWEDAVMKAMGYGDEKMSDKTYMDIARDIFAIEQAVSYKVYPDDNLSNGDEVTVEAILDNELVADYKIQFTGEKKTFIVEGLKKIKKIDLFEGVSVEFKGFAPYVKATIKSKNARNDFHVSYVLDKKENLTIGDTVTVTVKYDEDSLLRKGYIAKGNTKEFTIEECDRYVTRLEEIPAKTIEKMNKQFEDATRARVAQSWADVEVLNSIQYIGNYLLTPKEGTDTKDKNICYGIYKINVDSAGQNITYYSYCQFKNIIILKDGTCSLELMDYKMPEGYYNSGEAFQKGDYYYEGYEELDSLFNNCVTKNIDKYEYESTVTE